MRAREREPIMGVWGCAPSEGPGGRAPGGGQGAKPPEADKKRALHKSILPDF